MFGSVTAEGQAAAGLWFGVGVLLVAFQYGGGVRRLVPWPLALAAVVLLVLPLVPLPPMLVGWISPKTLELARTFPAEPGASPHRIPLSLSSASTIQRLWELWLVATAFCLARHSAGDERFPRILSWAVAAALVLLAVSDLIYRASGRQTILGVWMPSWGTGAGTFANRNHFANWCVAGLLFCCGWMLRSLQPLHAARTGASPSVRAHARQGHFLSGAVLFALVMTVLSGSRGGLVALVAGLAMWLALLLCRAHRRSRWVWTFAAVAGGLLLALAFGDHLLRRLAETPADIASRHSKLAIWKDTLAMAWQFPVFGVGWGAFAVAFGHLKTFGGGATFWHAENEYFQGLLEGGLAGVVLFAAVFFFVLRGVVRAAFDPARRLAEPETFFAALAALAAFAAHAAFEFVLQIPSTAMLAAVLLGFLAGSLESADRPALPPPPSRARVCLNLAWGLGLVVAAATVGVSWLWWEDALRARRQNSPEHALAAAARSLDAWPWSAERQLVRARMRVDALKGKPMPEQRAAAMGIRSQITDAIRRDPLNWELRLERAWLDLAFSTNSALAEAEAWEVTRLNPLQAQIPLRFARHYAGRNPALAWQFIEAARLENGQDLRAALEIAWSLPVEKALVWSLVPANATGLVALGDFGRDKGFYALAAQAYEQLRGRLPPAELAEKFLEIRRPDLALAQLPEPPISPRERLLAARAAFDLGRHEESIRHAESLWQDSGARDTLLKPRPVTEPAHELMARWKGGTRDFSAACQLAETVHQLPPGRRDVALLRQLADQFPTELRLRWIVFRAELEQGDRQAAARTALTLAERFAARE